MKLRLGSPWAQVQVQLGCWHLWCKERLPSVWPGSGSGAVTDFRHIPDFACEHLRVTPHPGLAEKLDKPDSLSALAGGQKDAQTISQQGSLGRGEAGRGVKPGRVEGRDVCFSPPPGTKDGHLQRSG